MYTYVRINKHLVMNESNSKSLPLLKHSSPTYCNSLILDVEVEMGLCEDVATKASDHVALPVEVPFVQFFSVQWDIS